MKKLLVVFCTLAVVALAAWAGQAAPTNSPEAWQADRARGGSLDTVGQVFRVLQVPIPPRDPAHVGVSIAVDCRGTLYYTNYTVPVLYKMTALGTLIDSVLLRNPAGAPVNIDEMSWDEGRQLLWGGEDGTQDLYLVDPATGICTFQFHGLTGPFPITDGLAFDPTDGTIWHSPDVSDSIAHFTATGTYLGSLKPLNSAGGPDLEISGICVGTNNRMYVGHDGQNRVSIVDKTTGAWIGEFFHANGRDEGLECDAINFAPDLVIWSKNAYDSTVTAIQVENGTCACAVLPDTCQFPYELVDMGDLSVCYPNLVNNPGHALTGIAWLGPTVTGEATPHTYTNPDIFHDPNAAVHLDTGEDGVGFFGDAWMPCTPVSVIVQVTAGPNYTRYADCGGHLYLSAWKDGNADGSFDDVLCNGNAPEWFIQDALVTPGFHTFTFMDPGVFDLNRYNGVFRFRLTHEPVGPYGYGLVTTACPGMIHGTFGLDSVLGEVEDYIVCDLQLAVELTSFDATAGDNAVALRWTTASESNNDHFELVRDGATLARVNTQGNNATGHTYIYSDETAVNGTLYHYTLFAVDVNGHREELRGTMATPAADAAPVSAYALRQNYPNPFNPTTAITFDLLDKGYASLKVYNLMGQEVATLVNRNLSEGRHTVSFDATNLPSGLYIYRLEAGNFVAEKKMLLMK